MQPEGKWLQPGYGLARGLSLVCGLSPVRGLSLVCVTPA